MLFLRADSGLPSLNPTSSMNSLIRTLDRFANWKTFLLLLALYASFPAYWLKNAAATINQLAGKTIGPVDLTMGFDPARTLGMIADYGPAARTYYTRVELTLDVAYPLVYALFLGVILTLLFRGKAYKPFGWVTLLPFVSQLFDYLENATIIGLLTSYPGQSYGLAVLCEIFKLFKWLTFGLVIGMIVYGLVRSLINAMQGRKRMVGHTPS